MALPSFRDDGWLPPGHHTATWQEIVSRFGGKPNSRRADILTSLLRWRDAARAENLAGLIILDGSFVSDKEAPGDFDLLFSYNADTEARVRSHAEARALTDYQACRALGFLGDVFALPASLGKSFPTLSGLDMFDFDRKGKAKGIVKVPL